jgi:hypothetical protein
MAANLNEQQDGTAPASLGSWSEYYVFALAASGSDVYVGGEFSEAGGVDAENLAKWNGSAWSAFGSGAQYGEVDAIAVNGSDVFVGGQFQMIDTSARHRQMERRRLVGPRKRLGQRFRLRHCSRRLRE